MHLALIVAGNEQAPFQGFDAGAAALESVLLGNGFPQAGISGNDQDAPLTLKQVLVMGYQNG